MKIKTEFNLGDQVYFVEKEKVKRAPIGRIYISVDENGTQVEYRYLKTFTKSGLRSMYTTIKEPKKTIEELVDSDADFCRT